MGFLFKLFGLEPGKPRDNKSIVSVLKEVEPGYSSWDDREIERQVEAIKECGYDWFEKSGRVGFKHSESGVFLLIEGLHAYSPEDIRKIYENVWSRDFDNVRKRDDTAKKLKEALSNDASDEELYKILEDHKKQS